MRAIRKILSFLLIPLIVVFFTSCTGTSIWNAIKDGKELKIAILASSDEYEEKSTFLAGVKLAIEEAKGKGYKVSYKIFNDEGNFDNGVAMAKEVIKNDEYKMAFSFQSMDTFDTVAKLFEEAKKPLFAIDGADDGTMKKVSKYIFNLQSSAEALGAAAGQYAVKKGYKSIAMLHSGNDFELNFCEGFSDSIDSDSSIMVVDSVMGPNKEQELESVFNRWNILDVDTVLLTFDDLDWAFEIIKLIKARNPNITIIADPYFNTLSYLKQYKDSSEGMIIPSNYPVDSTSKLSKFYSDNKSKLSINPTPLTAQGFDLLNMIIEKMQNNETVDDFVNAMKSNDGYDGITKIKFNEKGGFEREPNYLIVKNGAVVKVDL